MTAPAAVGSLVDAYGRALVELGEKDERIAVLESGRSGSTPGAVFAERFPDRFFHVGEMESSMMAFAAGLSLGGRTVFASAFSGFAAGGAYPSIRRSICRHRADVKVVATHLGASGGEDDGGSPMFEDIGLMRALPGMTVIVPADAPSARAATIAVAERAGPAYVRLSRAPLPDVSNGSFAIGKAAELRAGTDLAVVAIGALVTRALEVADELFRMGVSVRVLDFASVKPFDEPALLRAARDTGALLVLEEHSVLTGVGALVAATTAENYPVPVRRIGIPDVVAGSGGPADLLDRYGMSRERIRDEAWELLKIRGKVL